MTKIKNFIKRNVKGMAIGVGATIALMAVPKVGEWVSNAVASIRVKLGGVA